MPNRINTRCRHPGCPRIVRDRYCDEHRRLHRRLVSRRRSSSVDRGYDARWRRLRARYIARHPLCEDCLDEGVVYAADLEVDHVIPIYVRPDLRLAPTNLRTRCRMHHRRKTLEDVKRYGETT